MADRYTIEIECLDNSLESYSTENRKSVALRRARSIADLGISDAVAIWVYDTKTGTSVGRYPIRFF